MAIAPITEADLTGTVGFSLWGINLELFSNPAAVGQSVASAGDVNNDGYEDLIVGAPGADGGAADTGAAYLILGGPTRLSGTYNAPAAGPIIYGWLPPNSGVPGFEKLGLGWDVASAGDFNGDGFDDLVISLPGVGNFSGGPAAVGVSYVVFGSANPGSITVNTNSDGTKGFAIAGQGAADISGYSVAGGHDVNGDGFDDLIIGAPQGLLGDTFTAGGKTYVVFGHSGTTPAKVNLSTIATGSGGFVITGRDADDRSGYDVSSPGDINGDGIADILIAAPEGDGAGNSTSRSGETYIVFGRPDFGASIDLNTIAAGSGGFVINGRHASALTGLSVSGAGDVNGDGFADIIIGARDGWNEDAYVVFGKPGGFGASIDLDAIATGSGGFMLREYIPEGQFTTPVVGGLGDINGDGIDDFSFCGSQDYVILGRTDFDASVDLTAIAAGIGGFLVPRSVGLSFTGTSGGIFVFLDSNVVNGGVHGAGDIDGDGFDDIVIGAPGAVTPGTSEEFIGKAYVIYGKDFTGTVTKPGNAANNIFSGTAAVDIMVGGQGGDQLRGFGGADVLIGGSGDDILRIDDATFRRVDGGTGTDTLLLGGVGMALDLTAISATRLMDVEAINLGLASSLKLTQREVLNISSTNNTLTIDGDSTKVLRFDFWNWTQTDPSGGYDVYVNGAATLRVDSDISIAPSIEGAVAGQAVNDDGTHQPFSAVTISDPDVGASETVTITLTADGVASDANGLLSGDGLSKTGIGTYALAAGSPAEVTAALQALVFTPTAGQVAPGDTVTTGIILTVSDGTANTTDETTTLVTTSVSDTPSLYAWKNAASGDWSTAGDWDPAQVPGATDDALIAAIGADYAVAVTTAQSAANVTLDSANATLALTESLAITNNLSLAAGMLQLNAGGRITGGTLIMGGAGILANGGTLDQVTIHGTLDLLDPNTSLSITGGIAFAGIDGTGSGTINFHGGVSQISAINLVGDTTLDNATINIGSPGSALAARNALVNQDSAGASAILTLGADLTINQVDAQAALASTAVAGNGIVNQGTINAGGGVFTIEGDFTNTGTITITDDTLELDGAVNSLGGTVTGTGTLTLGNAGRTTLEIGTRLDVAGLIIEDTATLSLARTFYYAGNFSMLNLGTLELGGNRLILAGTSVIDTSDIYGPGTIGNTGMLSIGGALGTVLSGCALLNTGTVTQTGAVLLEGPTSPYAVVNGSAGTYNLTTDDGIEICGCYPSQVINGGLLAKTGGTGASVIAADFVSNGSIVVDIGAIELSGTTNRVAGSVSGAGEFVLHNSGTTSLAPTARITVAAFTVDDFATLLLEANTYYDGTFTARDGTIDLGGRRLILSDTSYIEGSAIIGNGTIGNTGMLTLGGSFGSFIDSSVLVNTGTINQDGLVLLAGLTTPHAIVNTSAGTYNLITDDPLTVCGCEPISIINAGTFAKTGGTFTSFIDADFISSGTVVVDTGAIELDGASNRLGGTITGAGALVLCNFGTTSLLGGTTVTIGELIVEDSATLKLEANAYYGGSFEVIDTGTVDLGGYKFVLSGTSSIDSSDIVGSGTIGNTGSLEIGGLFGTLLDASVLLNTGTVTQVGVLLLSGSVASHALVNASTGTYDLTTDDGIEICGCYPTSMVNGGLFTKTAGGGASFIGPDFTNSGTIAVNSGTIELGGISNLIGGKVTGTGELLLGNGGRTTIISGTQVDVATLAVEDLATLAVSGTLSYGGDFRLTSGGTVAVAQSLTLGGTNNEFAGVVTGIGDLDVTGNATITGTLIGRANSMSFIGGLLNDHTVITNGGRLTISATPSGTGHFSIQNGGVVEFDNGTNSDQSVDFLDPTGLLNIEDLPDFHALITGFTGATVIDLLNTPLASIIDYQYASDELTITTASGSSVLRIPGVTSVANFVLTDDVSSTGTAIHWVA